MGGVFGGGGGLPSGAIIQYAGTVAPDGWILCDGSAGLDSTVDTSLAALFAVIGTAFGGTGADDFDAPDLRGRVPVGLDNLGGVSANRITNANADSLAGAGGAESVALVTAELASHSHTGPNVEAAGSTYALGGGGTGRTAAIGAAGSGTAHANDQPWVALGFIIKK